MPQAHAGRIGSTSAPLYRRFRPPSRDGPYDAWMSDARKRIVASAYDRIADRYREWGTGVSHDPRDEMLGRFTRELTDGASVLDLGCGAGVPSTRQLAERFRVVGVDISPRQATLARRNVPQAEIIRADITEVAFPDESFDGIVSLYAVSHVPRDEHPGLFARAFAWLRHGGLLLANLGATDAPDWTGDWLGVPMFFSSHGADENRRLLRAAGFELELDEVLTTKEPEGDVSFLWVLGRKP